jgi:hypothetical protein
VDSDDQVSLNISPSLPQGTFLRLSIPATPHAQTLANISMRDFILILSLICLISCSKPTKEYTIETEGKRMTLRLGSDYKFRQLGSLWQEHDDSEYYGTWRYIDEENKIIETMIHGRVGDHIWTATPRDTLRIDGNILVKE